MAKKPKQMIQCDHCGKTMPLTDSNFISTYCGSIHMGCGAIEAHANGCQICCDDFKDRGLLEDDETAEDEDLCQDCLKDPCECDEFAAERKWDAESEEVEAP